MDRKNAFQRYKYSPSDNYQSVTGIEMSNQGNNMVVFSGGDLQAYINNIKVGNLESITWSISVEVVGNYVMGQRDAVIYTTGKRVVVGSMVFSQYNKHALLEQVFDVSNQLGKNPTMSSLWKMDTDAARAVGQPGGTVETFGSRVTLNAQNYISARDNNADTTGADSVLMRGLSRDAFERELRRMETDASRAAGAVKFNYTDQLPPFDMTLVGVTKAGDGARCSLFGLQVTQETAGFSQNDIGNSVGMSFVALAVSPWRPVDGSALQNSIRNS